MHRFVSMFKGVPAPGASSACLHPVDIPAQSARRAPVLGLLLDRPWVSAGAHLTRHSHNADHNDTELGTPAWNDAPVHVGNGHLRGMPAVSFTKAIDVWMATCLVFVFGSFIEYSVVNVLARREKTRRDATTATTGTSAVVLPVPLHNVDHQTKVRMRSSESVDFRCRLLAARYL